jgi:hypothetical protein
MHSPPLPISALFVSFPPTPSAGVDVMDMVSRQPRLLLQDGDGVRQRLESVLDKLTHLHPSHNRVVITGIGGTLGV